MTKANIVETVYERVGRFSRKEAAEAVEEAESAATDEEVPAAKPDSVHIFLQTVPPRKARPPTGLWHLPRGGTCPGARVPAGTYCTQLQP